MKNLLTLLFLLTIGFSLQAQNPAPPASFEIFTTIHNQESQLSINDLLLGIVNINNDSADYTMKIVLSLVDTLNISNIHISIGDSLNGNNLYNSVIPFNSLNTSSEYRNGNIIYILSDTLFNLGSIFGNVYLEDTYGNNSSNISYQSN